MPQTSAERGAPLQPWRPVPGPVDRESFFAAQARNRRATWRLAAVCIVAVLLMGIPLSVVVSPLVWALVFLINDIANRFIPTPDLLRLVAHAGEPGGLALPQPIAAAAGVAALILPGM